MGEHLKLYGINGSTLGVTTFANIEMGLKIVLLLVTIIYYEALLYTNHS